MGDGYVPRAAAGMAMTVGGFVALTGRFVVESEHLRPLLVGAVVAVLVYVPIRYAFPPLSTFDEVEPRTAD